MSPSDPLDALLDESPAPLSPRSLVPLDELERRYIQLVMDLVNGNKTRAARLLGLDRTTLYRKLDRYRQGTEKENQLDSRLDGLPSITRLL